MYRTQIPTARLSDGDELDGYRSTRRRHRRGRNPRCKEVMRGTDPTAEDTDDGPDGEELEAERSIDADADRDGLNDRTS